MSASEVSGRPANPPGVLRVGIARGGVELKEFFRDKQAWAFTFAFPVLLFVLFSVIFGETFEGNGNAATYFLPVLLAFGVMSTCFLNLGIGIAVERDDGTLKRLRGTPMPRSAYFVGKFVFVVCIGVAEILLLLLLGAVVFGVELPTAPGRWITFVWVVLLGAACFSLLGIAVSSLAGSGRNAGAVINLPFLVLQFVSGVFIPLRQLPDWLQELSAVFPARWFAQGMLSVFLDDAATAGQLTSFRGSWLHGTTALIIGAWTVAALVLCLTTFRWKGRRDG